ncbi:MAG: hypothetical protein HKL96_01950 [Phycisphaerales bacterium]|nr:hypothetical protein [Phycisphaerales bacterium]
MSYATIQPLMRDGTAVSPEGKEVLNATRKVVRHMERSQSLFGSKAFAISEVSKLADECAVENWDGNGAAAIDDVAVDHAIAFIRALPGTMPMPELAAEPDGSISLDWIQSRHRLFSLSIGCSERIAYAWLDGTDRGHAVAHFDGYAVPPRILDLIQSIVKYGNTSIRAA